MTLMLIMILTETVWSASS